MFSCKLRFVIDICKKWVGEKFIRRYLELDLDIFTKQRFRKNNPTRWRETKCSICNFDLAMGTSNDPNAEDNSLTYFDFVVRKEHSFVRKIFKPDELSACQQIKTLKKYYEKFKLFIQIVFLLKNTYSVERDIECDINDDCFANWQLWKFVLRNIKCWNQKL